MIQITKDVLRQLNPAAVGKLDTDTGKVFRGFVGGYHMTDRLFHGELRFADVGEEPPRDTVSIKSILSQDSSAKPAKAAKAKPVIVTDKEK